MTIHQGYSEETAVEDIEKGYQADMATYGGNLAEVEQNYRELPKQLFRGIRIGTSEFQC
ncbi:MAG: hypothetical protein R3C28_16915 [Pirellulaceae bacterium]